TAGAGNTVANNGGAGVFVGGDPAFAGTAAAGTGNGILGNSIHDNGQLGIDLAPNVGVTPNDAGDADTGSNNLQNFPVINSVTPVTGGTDINLSLNSTANTLFRIEFFSNTLADPSGF